MNPIEYFLARFYSYRSYRNHDKNLRRKIAKLRAENKFREHPAKPALGPRETELFTKNDLLWFDYFYSINGIASNTYIPLRPYYLIIEPTLNHRLMVSTLKDKNFYELFYANVDYPKVLLRCINGFYYDCNYELIASRDRMLYQLKTHDSFIIKASLDSGSGQSIFLFRREGESFTCGENEFNEKFLKHFAHDFLIQEVVVQHQYFRKFNPSSNNTVRVLVYRSVKDDSINVLHTLLRIGAKGSYLDHDNLGGVSLAINRDGKLADRAFDGKGNVLDSFNGISFAGQDPAPYIDSIRNAALKIAQKTFYGRLLALDFTVAESGQVMLLDINCWRNGISHYQLSSGSLFNEFTQEIIDHCLENPAFNIIRIPLTRKAFK